ISREEDPQEVLHTYAARMRRLMHFDRTIAVSRRGLDRPRFRITWSDLNGGSLGDAAESPVIEGGLLADLVYEGAPQILDALAVRGDDPAGEHLAGMGSAAAIPHFDKGDP